MVVVAVERTHAVAVRLSPVEYERWRGAATAAGRGQLAAWVRDHVEACLIAPAVEGQAPAPTAAPAPAVGVGGGVVPSRQALEQLARVGNLLNQTVRLGNSGGLDAYEMTQLHRKVDEVRQAMAAVSASMVGAS